MAGRPKKKPEYNPELQFNNFLQELRDAYEEADSLRSLADELNISLLKLCMLASRWNLLKRERGLMRSISQGSVRGSGRLWSSSEGSDRTDGAAAGWKACGLRGYGVLKRAPARSRTQRY